MTRAKLFLGLVVTGALAVAGAAACGADTFSGDALAGRGKEDNKTPSASGDGRGGTNSPGALGPTAEGVILVHAAKFRSFRLCFESQPDLPPQPDSTIMPEANVVGLEVGSVIRVDPLKAPGKIYVMRELSVRGKTGSCGELLEQGLIANNDYQMAALSDPSVPDGGPTGDVGRGKVQVLAITGCASNGLLPPNTSDSDCGSDYNPTTGNLKASIVDLAPAIRDATKPQLPVQLVHLSPWIDARKGAGGVEITYGPLDQSVHPEKVATDPKLLALSAPATVTVTPGDDTVFGKNGFRITIRPSAGPALEFKQSLANVQELSAPQDTPTAYYQAGSNYALLLLGDPSATPPDAGAADPTFLRRGVHLLAIPVIDPATLADAGSDSGRPDGG